MKTRSVDCHTTKAYLLSIQLNLWLAKRQLQQWIHAISYAQFSAILSESSADTWETIQAIPDGIQKERLLVMYSHETMWFDTCKTVKELEGNGPLNGKMVVTEATPIKANIGAIKCWYINSRGEPDYDYAGKNSIH